MSVVVFLGDYGKPELRMQHFYSCVQPLSPQVTSNGNWMHILYQSRLQAKKVWAHSLCVTVRSTTVSHCESIVVVL